MASSFPFSLDLNLTLPTQTWGQEAAPIWMPYFASSLRVDNNVAIGVTRSLVTQRDVHVLGTRGDNRVVSDAMTLSMQSEA
ncbi:unnamed protein product [Prunus armeniaca]